MITVVEGSDPDLTRFFKDHPKCSVNLHNGIERPKHAIMSPPQKLIRFADDRTHWTKWRANPWWIPEEAFEAIRAEYKRRSSGDPGLELRSVAKPALGLPRMRNDAHVVVDASVTARIKVCVGQGKRQLQEVPIPSRKVCDLRWLIPWPTILQIYIPSIFSQSLNIGGYTFYSAGS